MHVLKRLRDELGVTQDELARKLGVGNSAISGIESGRVSKMTDQIIKSVCLAYGVNEEWLRTGDDTIPMFTPKLTSALDKLCEEKGLSPSQRALVTEYLELSPRARELISDYIVSVADRIRREQGQAQIAAARSAFDEASTHPVDGSNSEEA